MGWGGGRGGGWRLTALYTARVEYSPTEVAVLTALFNYLFIIIILFFIFRIPVALHSVC